MYSEIKGERTDVKFSQQPFNTPVSRRAVLCDWVWWWRVGVHTGFCTITLVLYIRSLPNLATWFPCGRGRTLFILGSLGQNYYKLDFWQQDRFHTITLVLYIGFLTNSATWFACGRGRTLFILGSLDQGHHYYKYNFWQQDRFRAITLVLYVGSLPNLATWFPISCWYLFLVNIYSFLKYLGKNEKLNFKEIFFSFRNWKC